MPLGKIPPVLLSLALLLPVAQASEVPSTLTHQGRLLDGDGVPRQGPTLLSTTIYGDAEGTEVLWEGTVETDLDQGYFTVDLEGVGPDVLRGREAWLGLAVDEAPEMAPLVRLNAAPYAVIAGEAAQVREGAIGPEALASDFDLSEHVGTTLETLPCGEGQVARSDGSTWACWSPTQGTVTAVTAGAPLEHTGTDTVHLTLPRAAEGTSGYLHADDHGKLSDPRAPLPGSGHFFQIDPDEAQPGGVHLAGDAIVDGDLSVGTGLTIAGNADVVGDLGVLGDASVAGGLEVEEDLTVGEDLVVAGDLVVRGDLQVSGTLRHSSWPAVAGRTNNNHSPGSVVVYEDIWFDTGGHYDEDRRAFVAPVRGVYQMCAGVRHTGDDWAMLNTRVGDTFVFGGEGSRWLQSRDSGRQATGCILFEAEADDEVVNWVSTTYSTMQCTQAYCFFSVKLVAALE